MGHCRSPPQLRPAPVNPDELAASDLPSLRLPALADIPIAIVTGGASPFAEGAAATVAFLRTVGAHVEHLHLRDHGVTGNGHGLIYERNSDQALQPVLTWLEAHAHYR